ncbi:N-terminal nucleophile aminohydrolase [Macroventuria anomochaeta]|uniref:N-terminal nucleophile aminohydrolase n=1 Tax=Macroventuria anomochaeta TaxID=301207 RepID=A0ACB6SEG2_9PLEO|nr:N-terminal nucleophile aminohydrolase [Macroventuria anomochaeta]KAF2631990.1 N-terminal nucleophile aminohydrolase [Macroventuria anomochaeta]
MSASTRHYDGAYPAEQLVRKATRSLLPADEVCAIYVHAGAGYHSHQNERIHLEACNDAAAIGMCIMKNGGSAIDAIEAAIKLLEDREITNAGYGSNLAMDGVVECDASVVDHFGRSGAVGAVAQIKNPISLARMVYEHTSKPLTLRRVPPNLLCAQGATEFAAEQGMPVLPHDALVSPAAKERWLRWRADLKNAERKAKKSGQHPSCYRLRADVAPEDEIEQSQIRQRHTNGLLGNYPSLLQSSSPEPSDESLYYSTENASSTHSEPTAQSGLSSGSWLSDDRIPTPDTSAPSPIPANLGPPTVAESSRSAFINSTQKMPTLSQFRASRATTSEQVLEDAEMEDVSRVLKNGLTARKTWGDGSGEESDSATSTTTVNAPQPAATSTSAVDDDLVDIPLGEDVSTGIKGTLNYVRQDNPYIPIPNGAPPPSTDKPDHITDTVGAIAIDSWGRIACGASSGGIGMKYRGRVGPAALVGVGAAVIPLDPDDIEQTSVATVTSGTGEHMATTMAATTCAERLYQSVRKEKGGEYAEVTEDEALRSMIENEFMGHSSVQHSNSAGAIGILGVKKMRTGIMLFYGHNTDSFALASMSSDDDVPKCTMSRSNGNGQIAQGGRLMSYKTRKRTKVMPRQRQVG